MSDKKITVSNKAKWNFQEVIPIILFIGLSGIFWALHIATYVALGFAITMTVILVGFAAFITFISARRKYRSTMFATLHYDENLTIEVWMRQPKKDKWRGRMDKGKNKGELNQLQGIRVDNVQGTPVMDLLLDPKSKPVTLPNRLAEEPEVQKYLGYATQFKQGKLAFAETEWAEVFAHYIELPEENDPFLSQIKQKEITEVHPLTIPGSNKPKNTQPVEEPVEETLDPDIKIVTLSYKQFEKTRELTATEKIEAALARKEEEELRKANAEETNLNHIEITNIFPGDDDNKNSIEIKL